MKADLTTKRSNRKFVFRLLRAGTRNKCTHCRGKDRVKGGKGLAIGGPPWRKWTERMVFKKE